MLVPGMRFEAYVRKAYEKGHVSRRRGRTIDAYLRSQARSAGRAGGLPGSELEAAGRHLALRKRTAHTRSTAS